MQEQTDRPTTESAGAPTRKPETMIDKMSSAIEDIQRDLAKSHHEQDGEDEEDDEEETELSKLSDDDEPCWVMGTTS
jgi:hypothetical protein